MLTVASVRWPISSVFLTSSDTLHASGIQLHDLPLDLRHVFHELGDVRAMAVALKDHDAVAHVEERLLLSLDLVPRDAEIER